MAHGPAGPMGSHEQDIEVRLILEAIYERYHYDFRDYAGSSLRRRLRAAMQRFGCDNLSVLQGWLLGSYSARKLGLQTTGNAGGVFNLIARTGDKNFGQLVGDMGTGLVVTELMGQGVNGVTGDYSRGAAGFWVERGEIAYPVQELTIAGNLLEMFRGIQAIGNDVDPFANTRTGSVLLDRMTIAGN